MSKPRSEYRIMKRGDGAVWISDTYLNAAHSCTHMQRFIPLPLFRKFVVRGWGVLTLASPPPPLDPSMRQKNKPYPQLKDDPRGFTISTYLSFVVVVVGGGGLYPRRGTGALEFSSPCSGSRGPYRPQSGRSCHCDIIRL